jgi:outer membrane protein OmpA-like peptidoglycan-associated protein
MTQKLILSLCLLLALGGAGCKKKTKVKQVVKGFSSITVDAGSGLIRLKPGTSIQFATGSEEILEESKVTLDEVSAAMTQQSAMKVRVEGHTDSDGEDASNLDLSSRRAAAVKTYLEGKGIAPDRVSSIGCGEATPIADNTTDDGKKQNRRVEFVILKSKGDTPTCQVYQANTGYSTGTPK